MAKYRVPVSIQAYAGKTLGVIECDSLQEYNKKADELWESLDYDSPSTNISNDFEIDGDWELSSVSEADLKYYVE